MQRTDGAVRVIQQADKPKIHMDALDRPEEFQRALRESAWLLQKNQAQEAADKLAELYAIAPTNVDVAINLGGAYILLHKWNRAVDVLSRAAELHPENVMVWTNLAAAHLGPLELAGPQQQERAIVAYERALALDPRVPNVHYSLGLIHKDRRDWPAAAASFRRALEVNPADRDARYWVDWLNQQEQTSAPKPTTSAAAGDQGAGV